MSVATDDTEKAPLKLQAFSKNQAIVVLGDSKYYESIENALKIRKYVKTRTALRNTSEIKRNMIRSLLRLNFYQQITR